MCLKKKSQPVEACVKPNSLLETCEDGIKISEAYQACGLWGVKTVFYPKEQVIDISKDGTIIQLFYTEEEHSCFDPREQKENYEVYENKGVRTLELKTDLYTGWLVVPTTAEGYVETSKIQTEHNLIRSSTPLEEFHEKGSKYRLIDSEEEFQEYLDYPYDISLFCDLKLYRTLKGFGLDGDEIQKKARVVGHDLLKYNKLLAIMDESKDNRELFEFLFRRCFEEGCVISALALAPCSI